MRGPWFFVAVMGVWAVLATAAWAFGVKGPGRTNLARMSGAVYTFHVSSVVFAWLVVVASLWWARATRPRQGGGRWPKCSSGSQCG